MKPYRIDADLEKSKCICGYPKFICGYPYETANAESAWLALVCMRENSHVQSSVPASSSQAPTPPPLALCKLPLLPPSSASSSQATSQNWAAHRHLLPATVSCYTAGLPLFVCLFIFVVDVSLTYFVPPHCLRAFFVLFYKTTSLACFYFSFVSSLLQDHIHNIAGSLLLQCLNA